MFRNITQYFQAMLKNIINSHCSFNMKETQVCARADLLKCGRTSAHIFRICSVQNCLSQVNISETVCPENDKQTAFYSPLHTVVAVFWVTCMSEWLAVSYNMKSKK